MDVIDSKFLDQSSASVKPKRHIVLLGSGASIEAGLSTSADLTKKIYDDIGSTPYLSEFAKQLAYVISRLQHRNTLAGLSPYQPIEVEELFDALNLLYRRDSLLVSHFVERWDKGFDQFNEDFDGNAIKSAFNFIINGALAQFVGDRGFIHLQAII